MKFVSRLTLFGGRAVQSHSRRLWIEFCNVVFNHEWVFRLLGAVNRRFRFLESVFLVYPASRKYALAYVYARRLPIVKWNPWPCGLLWQNGKLGLTFCISASNEDFADPANDVNLRLVAERMEQLRLMLGAQNKTFAGSLPGILYGKRIVRVAPEADLSALAVVQALAMVKTREKLNGASPVIVLGGKGFIGRRVVKLISEGPIFSLDIADGSLRGGWPAAGERSVVVNVTTKNALDDYLEIMPEQTVIINEVYPEPSQETLTRLAEKKCKVYHVVGVKGGALPPFPAAYRGAIPCCAAWPSPEMMVLVRRIN